MVDPDSYFAKAEDVNFMDNIEQRNHPLRWSIFYKVKDAECSSVLDVGCNIGIDYSIYKGHVSYYGIDFQEKYLKRAIELLQGGRFSLMDARKLKFGDESFDAVYTKDVLEHLNKEDVATVIKEMWRVCRKIMLIGFFHLPREVEEIKIHDAGFWDNTYSDQWFREVLTKVTGKTIECEIKAYPPNEHALYIVHK